MGWWAVGVGGRKEGAMGKIPVGGGVVFSAARRHSPKLDSPHPPKWQPFQKKRISPVDQLSISGTARGGFEETNQWATKGNQIRRTGETRSVGESGDADTEGENPDPPSHRSGNAV